VQTLPTAAEEARAPRARVPALQAAEAKREEPLEPKAAAPGGSPEVVAMVVLVVTQWARLERLAAAAAAWLAPLAAVVGARAAAPARLAAVVAVPPAQAAAVQEVPPAQAAAARQVAAQVRAVPRRPVTSRERSAPPCWSRA
jgi:hypothetical protein